MLLHVIEWLILLLGSGAASWLFTEMVKKMPQVPFVSEGDVAAIRLTNAFFSSVIVAASSWYAGVLQPEHLQSVALTFLMAVGAWLTAHVTHKVLKANA